MGLVGEAPSLGYAGSEGCGLVTPGGATPGGARSPVGGWPAGESQSVSVGNDCPLRVALRCVSRVHFSHFTFTYPKSCAKM